MMRLALVLALSLHMMDAFGSEPSFPEGALISFRKIRSKDRGGNERDFAAIEFPAATHPRANDYEVRLERFHRVWDLE